MKMLRITFFAAAALICSTQAYAVMCLTRPYEPNTARWLTRDPIGEQGSILLHEPAYYEAQGAGGGPEIDLRALQRSAIGRASLGDEAGLYVFNRNDGVNFVDPLGLMRIQDLIAKFQARKQADANIPCCCVSPKISGSIAGYSQGGASVLAYYSKEFTDVFFFDRCIFQSEIYWWDCYSASDEGGWSWKWADYGWSGPGSYNYQKIAYPNSWSLRDPYHLAMLSVYVWDECVNGKQSTQWKASNGLQWTWDKSAKQWTGPAQVQK